MTIQPVASVTANSSQVYAIASGARLDLRSGTSLTLASGVTMSLSAASMNINSGGSFTVNSGATFNHNASGILTNDGTLNVSNITYTVAGTLTTHQSATNTFTNVVVASGGTINHPANTTAETYKLDLSFNNLTVNSGGFINTDNRGYTTAQGPGGSPTGAGSYAGYGTDGNSTVYGSITAPVNLGSGGSGHPGAGAMKLSILGNLVNNGSITSSATNSTCGNGGGSGGSVWIDFTGGSSTLSGSGTIATNGNPNAGGFGCGGTYRAGGSGGRIALTGYTSNTLSGAVQSLSTSTVGTGAAGTIFRRSTADTSGHLEITASNPPNNYTPLGPTSTYNSISINSNALTSILSGSNIALASGGTFTLTASTSLNNLGNLTTTGATLSISGTFTQASTVLQNWGTVTINSGGILTHAVNTVAKTSNVNIQAGSLTINTGGFIDVNGRGFSGGAVNTNGNGTGAGLLGGAVSAGGGASYGGVGTAGGGANGGATGMSYGSNVNPLDLGSGGGGGVSGAGGSGGGQINIAVLGTFINNGIVRANGTNGTAGAYGGGGGSGGSIRIITNNYVCSTGSLSATGGSGAGVTAIGGNGGGGRAAFYVTGTYTPCGSTTVGNGTLYVYPGRPAVPVSLSASNQTATSITWQWVDNSISEDGFYIYDASDNSLLGTIPTVTQGGTGSTYNFTQTGLEVDTVYGVYVSAYNFYEEGNPTSTLSTSTLEVNPSIPTVNNPTINSLTVTLNQSSEPIDVEYYIYESSTSLHVQSDGQLSASQTEQTYSQWGGVGGINVINLQSNTRYTFGIFVDGVGGPTASLYTLAATPPVPTIDDLKATSTKITLTDGANPSSTLVALYDTLSNKYIQSDNFLGVGPVWQTTTQWNTSDKTAKGLTPNTLYTFVVLARNGDGVVSSPSSDLNIQTPPPAVVPPVITTVDNTTVQIILNQATEPEDVLYSVLEENTDQYLTPAGQFSDTEVLGTYTDWGGSSGTIVSDLEPGHDYSFVVISSGNTSSPSIISIPEVVTQPPNTVNNNNNSTSNPSTQVTVGSSPQTEPELAVNDSEEQPSDTSSNNNENNESTATSSASVGFFGFLSQESLLKNRLTRDIVKQFEKLPDVIAVSLPWLIIALLALFVVRLYLQIRREVLYNKRIELETQKLKRLNEQKQNFIGLISHYLRTPLTIIRSTIEMIPSSMPEISTSDMQALSEKLRLSIEEIINNTGAMVTDPQNTQIDQIKSYKLLRPAILVPAFLVGFMMLCINILLISGSRVSGPIIYVLAEIITLFIIIQVAGSYLRSRALNNSELIQHNILLDQQKQIDLARATFITDTSQKLFGLHVQIKKSMDVVMASEKSIAKIANNGVSQLGEVVGKIKRADLLQRQMQTLNIQPISVEGFIKQTPQINKIQHGDLVLTPEAINSTQHICVTDKDLAQTVVDSVVDNAIKFSPENSLALYSVYDGNNLVNLKISDNGVGIPEHIVSNIFQPFSRGDTDVKDFTYDGMGLDLYIDKMAMNYLGGDVLVESTVGKGTDVTLSFPLKS